MQGIGIVKAVLSGDTVVLQGASRAGTQAPELQLSLSHLSAPRIARHPDQRDEPFGWPAREYLRKVAVGKQVRFRVDYKVDKINRAFATLWLLDAPAESLNLNIARNGWARVNVLSSEQSKLGRSDEYETLVAAGKAAEEGGHGMYNKTEGLAEATVRTITWSLSASDAAAVADVLKGTPQPAIVEGVVNGGAYRVLLTATAPSLAVIFNLAGIQAPRVPAGTAAPTTAVTAPAPSAAPAAAAAAGHSVVRIGGGVPGSALVAGSEDATAAAPKLSWATKGAGAAASAAPSAAGAGGAAAHPPAGAAAAPAAAAGPSSAPTTEAAIAVEGRALAEAKLLHRDVVLHVGGADKHGNLFGRIELPTAPGWDVAVELVKQGSAKTADWSMQFVPASYAATLRAAERGAKAARARLWHAYAPVEVKGERRFEGRVAEVLSGDTLLVAVNRGGAVAEEKRVSLASVRAPRMGARGAEGAPWSAEAKEFLRRTLVGREVSVAIDYVRVTGGPAAAGAGGEGAGGEGQERAFATVTYAPRKGGEAVNVAAQLIGEGLAEVVRHRSEEDRASCYDELQAAEEGARAAKRGLFSGKEPAATKKPQDLSADSARAKAHFPFLQRARTLRGVVDYVFAGGRVKVTVPSENCSFIFGVAGVRCPGVARAAGKGPDGKPRPGRAAEPFGQEAQAWMREQTLQQDVELEVDEVDKNGTMLGPMWTGRGGARRSVGADLLRAGLGSGIRPVIERVRDSAELVAAEAEAKAARLGVWQHWVEPVAEEEEAEADGGEEGAAAGADGGDFPAIAGAGASTAAGTAAAAGPKAPAGSFYGTVCEVVSGSAFYVHQESDRARIAEVTARLAALLADVGTQSAPVETKKGKVVACLFKEGDAWKWFRARVEGRAKTEAGAPASTSDGLELHEVTFIDYGNKDTVTVQRLRPLDASIAGIPPLARECGLAYVRVPPLSAEYGNEAAGLLSDMAYGRRMLIKMHGREGVGPAAKQLVSLWNPEKPGEECVNVALVEEGLGRISRTETRRVERRLGGPGGMAAAAAGGDKDADLLQRLRAAVEVAKKARAGLFMYGDAGDSEDERR